MTAFSFAKRLPGWFLQPGKSIPKALLALPLAYLMVAGAGLLTMAPALFGPMQISGTFRFEHTPEGFEFPIEIEAASGGLVSLSCARSGVVDSGVAAVADCVAIADQLSEVDGELEAMGIRVEPRFENISIRPKMGSQFHALVAGVLALLLAVAFSRFGGVSWRADVRDAGSAIASGPWCVLVPYLTMVAVTSLVFIFIGPTSAPTRAQLPMLELVLFGVIVAPVLEELVYRGFLYRHLDRHFRPWFTAYVTAMLFTLQHAVVQSEYGWAAIPIFAASLSLNWLRRSSGSIILCMAAHSLSNALVFATLWRASQIP